MLAKALSTCFATGQDEFADQHLGAFLEWCAPADGRVWQRVAAAEQLPASGATSPEFDREHLEPAVDGYNKAIAKGDHRRAASFRKTIELLIGEEIRRRHRLAVAALQLLATLPEGSVASEIAAEDRASFLQHVDYVADPNNHLRRTLGRDMQTSEFISREFAVDWVNGLGIRSVSGAYARAHLAGDLLEGDVTAVDRQKFGRKTIVKHTVATSQQLSLRSGDKLSLIGSESVIYRVLDIWPCAKSGRTLVSAEVVNGKTRDDLPRVGSTVVLAAPLRDRSSLGRSRSIAWDRMKARAAPVPAATPLVVQENLAAVVAKFKKP